MSHHELKPEELTRAQERGRRGSLYPGLSDRIRELLKTWGPHTAREMGVALKVPSDNCRTMAGQMEARGKEVKILKRKHGRQSIYADYRYVEPPLAEGEVATEAASVVKPAHQKFVRSDRDPNRLRCPECGSARLHKSARTYTCGVCMHVFAHTDAVTDAQADASTSTARRKNRSAGSGQIAAPTYATGLRWHRPGFF